MKLEHILIPYCNSQWTNYQIKELYLLGCVAGCISEVFCDLADRDQIMSSLFQTKICIENIRLRKENPEDGNTRSTLN